MKELVLYKDQEELFQKVRAGMMVKKSNLIVSPTGSGKTAVSAYMIQRSMERGNKPVFAVPRRTLLAQTSESFNDLGIKHSYISSGKQFNPYAKAWIGTIDTMARRLDKLPDSKLVFIDETHFGDTSVENVINEYKRRGAWILGLSASPWKLNGKGLGCWYDAKIEGKSVKWLIDNKRLSDFKYFSGRTRPDLSGLKITNGDYAKKDVSQFMEQQGVIIGDCVSDYKKHAMGNIHVVRCASIKHSQLVTESFNNAGIRAVHVDGKTPEAELKRIFRAFAMRQIQVICFCDLLGFGFDLSQISGMDVCIESISDLKPSKSLAGQLQYWGRGLRMKEKPAIICDHVNNYIEHGFPDDAREWTLEDRSQSKSASEGRATPVKSCEQCFYAHKPAPVCPNCGHVYPVQSRDIDEVDGELYEIDRSVLDQRAREEAKKKREQKKAQFVAIGRKRKYANPEVWAENIIRTQGIK